MGPALSWPNDRNGPTTVAVTYLARVTPRNPNYTSMNDDDEESEGIFPIIKIESTDLGRLLSRVAKGSAGSQPTPGALK